MRTKSEITTQFILETVAPVFNKHGYVGTSMADITKATGLTKGAIYGNFENKEALAIEAFNYNIRKVIGYIAKKVNDQESASQKLQAITDFYRGYYQFTIDFGGCPIVNVGVDANNQQSALTKRVKQVIEKLQAQIADILRMGVKTGEFRKDLDCDRFAYRIFSLIEGAIFMAVMMRLENHMDDMMDHIDAMINTEIKN